MKKINKVFITLICCGVLVVAVCGVALADQVIRSGQAADTNSAGPDAAGDDASSGPVAAMIQGPVLQVNDEYILIDSVSDEESGPVGMVSLRVDPDLTLIVDAADGYPVALSDIQEGQTVCAYVGAAMTLSLPPQMLASMVITDVPADGIAPLFTKVVSFTGNEDGSYELTAAGGAVYNVPADCTVRPYLTRNIVTLSDIRPGSNCLVWYDDGNVVSKIVIIQQ